MINLRTYLLVSLLGFGWIVGLVGCTANVDPALASEPTPTATVSAVGTSIEPTQAASVATDHSAELEHSTEAQLAEMIVPARDLRDLTVRLRPEVADVPAVVNATAPDYAVGDQIPFRVHDLRTRTNREITAELIYRTPVAYVWIERGQPYNRDAIIQAVDRFSNQSYAAEVAFFGSEWNPGVDNDPRLHILHATGVGSGVAGYYSSADQYSRLANPYSNEKELFYINLEWLNSTGDYHYYETVLAHEFQHMIHWYKDSNEWTWINEGLSEFAQEVTGFGTDTVFVNAFVNQPDTQLNAWHLDPVGNSTHYGASYLFIHYLNARFGDGFLTSLVAQPADGIVGVQAALDAEGEGLDFDELFADWVVANYADQPDALGEAGRYGYVDLDFAKPVTAHGFDGPSPTPYASTVHNYATDYLRLDGSGDFTLEFAGQTTTTLVSAQPNSDEWAWWSNKGDASDSRLTRQFDLGAITAGTPITMSVTMWWDIEENYDYGYVLASRDGQKWTILSGEYTSTANPAGNSFGPGYTGQSNSGDQSPGWVTEQFDLSPYAGEQIQLRFEYVTDDAINAGGWLIDDLRIPALGYVDDFDNGAEGWQSEGWLLTNNRLAQRWLVQVLEFTGEELTGLQRLEIDETGRAEAAITGLGGQRHAILAISALAPITTQPASYEITVRK
jgi:immune inhibitor A